MTAKTEELPVIEELGAEEQKALFGGDGFDDVGAKTAATAVAVVNAGMITGAGKDAESGEGTERDIEISTITITWPDGTVETREVPKD